MERLKRFFSGNAFELEVKTQDDKNGDFHFHVKAGWIPALVGVALLVACLWFGWGE